jgi:hypothetical protein
MTRLGDGVTAAGGLAATIVVLSAGTTPALTVLVGTALLLAGSRRTWRTGTNVGGLTVLGGVVYAGTLGLPPQALVVATIGALLAWDGGVTTVGLAEQLDEDAASGRAELVHTGATLVAAAGVGAVLVLTFAVGDGLVAPAAVVPVAAGVILLAAGLSPRTPN